MLFVTVLPARSAAVTEKLLTPGFPAVNVTVSVLVDGAPANMYGPHKATPEPGPCVPFASPGSEQLKLAVTFCPFDGFAGDNAIVLTTGGVLSMVTGTVLNCAQFVVGLLLNLKFSSSVLAQSVAKKCKL